jgi:hypothetical protein
MARDASACQRIDGTNTYRVTTHGPAHLFTQVAARVVVPAPTQLAAPARPHRSAPPPLAAAWRSNERELKLLLRRTRLVA